MQAVFCNQHISGSLRTCDPRRAIALARSVAAQLDLQFQALRQIPSMASQSHKLGYVATLSLGADGTIKAELRSEPHDTPEMLAVGHAELAEGAKGLVAASAARVPGEQSASPTAAGLSFQAAVLRYLAAADLKSGSLKNYKGALKRAEQYFGADRDLSAIKQRDFAAYVGHLLSLGKSRSTVEGYVVALSAMGTWFRTRGEAVHAWSSSSLIPRDPEPKVNKRTPHSLDDLQQIFMNALQYRETQPTKFWATLIVAFTGCRIEEVAQVDLIKDFKKSPTGTQYFVLNEYAEDDGEVKKSLKKAASWRAVPLHSKLVGLGLIEFLQVQVERGFSRPFESEWSMAAIKLGIEGREKESLNKWSHGISKWGSREQVALIKSGKLARARGRAYFHSMRHAVTEILRGAGVDLELRCAILGHEVGNVNADVYTRLRQDADALSRVMENHLGALTGRLDMALATQGS